MTIIEQARGLTAAIKADDKTPSSKARIGAQVLGLVAELSANPEPEISTEVFEILGAEGRQLALAGFCFVLLQTLQD